MIDASPTSLDRIADRLGGLVWISEALFELVGSWAAVMADDRGVEHLAVAARRHGWHAELVRDLLPDSRALAAVHRIDGPAGWDAAMSRARRLAGDPARLAALYRVLVPRLAGEVASLRSILSGAGDAAIRRALTFVADDLADDLAGGSLLLGTALADEAAIGDATDATKALDLALANR